jgi:RNA binding exosome subunit
MDKNFDDLFEDFFNKMNLSSFRNEAKKIIQSMNDYDDITNKKQKDMEELFGEPDKIETYFDGQIYYEKKTWHTENGDIIIVSASTEPFEGKQEKSLQEQLEEAIIVEDYEKAAEIRDKIKALEKPIKKPRKKSS